MRYLEARTLLCTMNRQGALQWRQHVFWFHQSGFRYTLPSSQGNSSVFVPSSYQENLFSSQRECSSLRRWGFGGFQWLSWSSLWRSARDRLAKPHPVRALGRYFRSWWAPSSTGRWINTDSCIFPAAFALKRFSLYAKRLQSKGSLYRTGEKWRK